MKTEVNPGDKPTDNTAPNEPAVVSDDKFDPRKLTLNQSFVDMVGVKKETLRVPLARPPAQVFFWPHPDSAWRIQVAALEIKGEGETYIVAPAMLDELSGEWVAKVLVACQTRQGGLYLWPIRLPGADGRIDSWNEAALHIINNYGGQWIRVMANREIGAYDVVQPISPFPAPIWPGTPDDLLRKAFRDRVIDSVDHPVVRRLRGLI